MKHTRWNKRISAGLAVLAACATLSGCATTAKPAETQNATATANTQAASADATALPAGVYHRITAAQAKQIIDADTGAIVVDVREQSEYDSGHIPNAILLSLGSIEQNAATALPDQNAQILVYCYSGARSKAGAQALLALGYTNVLDIGGISTWPYEVVKD